MYVLVAAGMSGDGQQGADTSSRAEARARRIGEIDVEEAPESCGSRKTETRLYIVVNRCQRKSETGVKPCRQEPIVLPNRSMTQCVIAAKQCTNEKKPVPITMA